MRIWFLNLTSTSSIRPWFGSVMSVVVILCVVRGDATEMVTSENFNGLWLCGRSVFKRDSHSIGLEGRVVSVMENETTNQPPAEVGEEVNVENTLLLIAKAKTSIQSKLNQIRWKFMQHQGHMNTLSVDDDYVDALRFLLKQNLTNGVLLSAIAPMFPDVAKFKAARAALIASKELVETTSSKIKTLKYIGQPA